MSSQMFSGIHGKEIGTSISITAVSMCVFVRECACMCVCVCFGGWNGWWL